MGDQCFKLTAMSIRHGSFAASLTAMALAAHASGASKPILMNAPTALKQACSVIQAQVLAAKAGWKVVCPTRVPYTVLPIVDHNDVESNVRHGYLIDVLGGAGHTHWTLAAGDPAALDKILNPLNADGKPTGILAPGVVLHIHGQRVVRYLPPPYANGGGLYAHHVVFQWNDDGEEYQVTVHRFTAEANAQAMDTASNLIDQLKH
jgi:hypothetical protein